MILRKQKRGKAGQKGRERNGRMMGESLSPELALRDLGSDCCHSGTKTPRNTKGENERPRHFTASECLTLPSIQTFCTLKATAFYPSCYGQLHQWSSFIRCCPFPFTCNSEITTGHSLLGPGVWYAAPVGTTAELWLLVCNEGQYGLVISAGEGWEVGMPRFSCQLSHFASPSSKWEYHLLAPQACQEDWLTFVDIFKREEKLSRQHCKKAACRQTVLLSLLLFNVAFTPQTDAYTVKEWLYLDLVMPERFVAVRHNYNTQQLQNKWLLSKGKVAYHLPRFVSAQKFPVSPWTSSGVSVFLRDASHSLITQTF